MIDQRRRIFAVKLWLLDLALTAASFFLAYRVRKWVNLEGYTVLPVQEYLWLLAIILPTWAVLLPLFRVYSELMLPPLEHIVRLTKAVFVAGLLIAALQFFITQDTASRHRLLAVLTVGINYALLVSSRLVM